MKTALVIDQQKAIELILNEMYYNEFEVIDRLNQHPQGLNFWEWLHKKELIFENLTEINSEIEAEIEAEYKAKLDDFD